VETARIRHIRVRDPVTRRLLVSMESDTTTLRTTAPSQRAAKPRLRPAVLALSAIALAACGTAAAGGGHPTTSSHGRPLPTSPPAKALLLEVSTGCPKTLGDATTVRNTGPGLADTFVPGTPTAALVCRYSPGLYRSTHLDAAQAQLLAETIDHTALGPNDVAASCPEVSGNPGGTVIAFSIPGRADVDIWYADYGCESFTNGVRTANETGNVSFYDGFMPLLDRLSPSDIRP
jgi:hypothetical protein